MSEQQTPQPLTEEQLDEIEQWTGGATLAPCTITRRESWPPDMFATVKRSAEPPFTLDDMIGMFTGPNAHRDALFNARAREAVPLILIEIRQLRAKVREQNVELARLGFVEELRKVLPAGAGVQPVNTGAAAFEDSRPIDYQECDRIAGFGGAPTDSNQGEGEPNPSDD